MQAATIAAHRQQKLKKTVPCVGVVACVKSVNGNPIHAVKDRYLISLIQMAGVMPVILPGDLYTPENVPSLLADLDGLFLPGSPSNVAASHYNAEAYPGMLTDERRDAHSLALIRLALAHHLPLFGVCRGFQEINVALGGSLHQKVEDIPGYHIHYEDPAASEEVQFGVSHSVGVVADGQLARILGIKAGDNHSFPVNSLHHQGINRLAKGLTIEAYADDGLIEAVSVTNSPVFAMAVQWHPEWQGDQQPHYKKLFTAFGDACRNHIFQAQTGT